MELISLDDVRGAADRIKGLAVRTPLLHAPWADRAGSALWLKAESLQPIGAFKIRGAVNAVSVLGDDVRARGVVTHSSGNHGRALAWAARRAGIPAVVVMPGGTPQVKIDGVRDLGAEIVMVDPADRLPTAQAIAAERGMTIVPPFDDRSVIAGQGTIGLEIVEDLPDVEVVVFPVGGGGMASGIATAVRALRPAVRLIGVEPELAAETRESLAAGVLHAWPTGRTQATIADGVRTGPSELTFAHIRARVDGIVTVTEEQITAAVGRIARESKLVVEPSGALGVAAYLSGALPAGRTAAVLSGGNLEPNLLAQLISS